MRKLIHLMAGLFFCLSVFLQSAPALAGINPEKTAIVVIDMWNSHWCMTASERVSAMVPRMNEVLRIARDQGMQVVWNPSDVVTAYSGYPQYEKAVAVSPRKTPHVREVPAAKFTAPGGGCMCGPGIRCGGNYGWDAMHPDLIIGDNDLISASTDEIYTLLADRGITDIIYMGVHTNVCVYGKPGGLSEMWAAGFNCMLARDLNDAITLYNPDKPYTPDDGTAEIDGNLLSAGIPVVNIGEMFQKAGLMKTNFPVDYVRFVPWGKPDRPYFTQGTTVVTLTAPWLEDAEIRYTTDGSEPTARSPLYSEPLKISQTTTVRATAFRKGKPVSLPSFAYYVKMPAEIPPQPDVYLEDLEYIPNAYIHRVKDFMWLPKKWKSFEGKPLRVTGKTYTHGMGFRAPSSVQYDLKPEYKRFVARAGIDENMLFDNQNGRSIAIHSSVVFKVFIDGNLAAESPVMRISQEPWRFDVEIPEGSRRINLVCMDAGSRSILDYGNWVDAGFVNGKLPRFVVISDTHFENNIGEGAAVKVPRALKNLFSRKPLPDAIFIVGDMTHRGKVEQYRQLLSVFSDKSNVPEGVKVYYIMGYQHDKSENDDQTNFLEVLKAPLHQLVEIKGYPFVYISEGSRRETPYNLEARRFLEENMAIAAAKYPGKPIFTFMHIPPLNTCYGSVQGEGWGTDFFLPVLNKYPQAIVFSGHSHFPLGDPRSIHQGIFTSVNDGSTTCSEVEPHLLTSGIAPEGHENVTEGIIVNVLSNGNVEMERWDTYRNEEILPRWTVEAPHDGSRFTYKNRNGLPAPVFTPNATVNITAIHAADSSCVVTFPQATDNEVVHHYLTEIMDGDKIVAANRTFSQFYLNSQMPESLSVKISGLPLKRKLVARVKALDSYKNPSIPVKSKTFQID